VLGLPWFFPPSENWPSPGSLKDSVDIVNIMRLLGLPHLGKEDGKGTFQS
jgi:hypothetical protein